MATTSIFKCNACGHEFEAYSGGLKYAAELRCEKCDNRKMAEAGTKQGICERCGGKMKDNLLPMCLKCKSRDIEHKKVLMHMD